MGQGAATFSRIDVAGNERIEADTVRVFSGIEPGQAVSPGGHQPRRAGGFFANRPPPSSLFLTYI
jgi:hypothetical protein